MKGFLKGKKRHLFLAVLLIFVLVSAVYINDFYKAMPEANATMVSNDLVTYKGSPWIEFTGKQANITKGLIIYPGGKVEPEAYAPLAEKIAEAGYKVVIVPMVFKLAVMSPNRAQKVMDTYGEITQWSIAGHSLGGTMAAQFAYKNPEIKNLFLIASYPTKSSDLSARDIDVVSVYGSLDGFVLEDDIEASRKLLPPDTKWVEIEGGNHSQMGWYGFQEGDNEAGITREAQQQILVDGIMEAMKGE